MANSFISYSQLTFNFMMSSWSVDLMS